MKTLKELGVPFGARMVYRISNMGTIVAVSVLALSIPLLMLWALCHQSGELFLENLETVLKAKIDELVTRRQKLARMYSK